MSSAEFVSVNRKLRKAIFMFLNKLPILDYVEFQHVITYEHQLDDMLAELDHKDVEHEIQEHEFQRIMAIPFTDYLHSLYKLAIPILTPSQIQEMRNELPQLESAYNAAEIPWPKHFPSISSHLLKRLARLTKTQSQ